VQDPAKQPRLPQSVDTKTLVEEAADGSEIAVETLCQRLRPRLAAWAGGRLPAYARDLLDTDDLVQEALVRSLQRLPVFENQGSDSFLQYLKTAVLNRVRSEIRRIHRQGVRAELDEAIADPAPTALEQFLGKEAEARYSVALAKLTAEERELVIARVELQMTAQEIAVHAGRPSPDAARMAPR